MKILYGRVWRQAKTMLVLVVPLIVFLFVYPFLLKPGPVPELKQEPQTPPVTVEIGQSKPAAVIRKYRVEQGDNLSSIAVKYHVDVETLLAANDGVGDVIRPGQELLILPEKGVLHIVSAGETLSRIAEMYMVKLDAILHANNKDSAKLAVGEKLFIPGGKRTARFEAEVSRARQSRMAWPTVGEISSPFGYRWGKMHTGIDIANESGTPIRAVLAGRIIFVGWVSGYGKTVMIEHSKGFVTLYGHLARYSVAEGQAVLAGQTIASMGSTGNSTGPHLHFEVQVNGTALNPVSVLP
jgi:murein DD-endopeptidase MepM/ murein hydrolase activator NlpD